MLIQDRVADMAEMEALRLHAKDLAALIPDGAALVEFGSGSSRKTRLVLEAAPQLSAYVPIDISESALLEAAAGIRRLHPGLEVAPVAADFTAPVAPPQALQGRRMVGFFPGSTIGNFVPAEARRFLARAREWLGPSPLFLVGVDLVKPQAVLEAAYDDAQGVTAAFNLNLLVRANRELGADFDLSGFAHRALWNPGEGRVEMHLVSRRAQSVRLAGRRIDFAAGEARNTASWAMSFGSIIALIDCSAMASSFTSVSDLPLIWARPWKTRTMRSPSTAPGAMALARMPHWPSSMASVLVKPMTPHFVAA